MSTDTDRQRLVNLITLLMNNSEKLKTDNAVINATNNQNELIVIVFLPLF